MKRLLLVLLLLVLVLFHQQLFTWGAQKVGRFFWQPPPAPAPAVHTFTVAASFPVAASLARQIGAGHLEVVSPLPPQADPLAWIPSSAQMAAFFGADLILLQGAHLESWTDIYTLPPEKTVRLADTVKNQWLHDAAGKPDVCTWMDPQLAIAQAESLRDALASRDRAHASDYAQNAANVRHELERLELGFKALPLKTVLAAAPRYAYLARRCGWRVIDCNLPAALAPTEAQLDVVRAAKAAHPEARILLWDEQPFTQAELPMTQLGLVSVVIDPHLRTDPRKAKREWVEVMKENLEKLRDATR